MNETPAEQLGEHILEEGELERFYADAYKWQSFARR
jgi:hypothetical protein